MVGFFMHHCPARSRLLVERKVRLRGGDEPEAAWAAAERQSDEVLATFETELRAEIARQDAARQAAEKAARRKARPHRRAGRWLKRVAATLRGAR
jgi:hypothetical protein